MKRLVVYEGATIIRIGLNEANGLTEREADELARHIRLRQLKAAHFKWSRHSFQIINYVGYIELSTVSIEVLPKVSSVDAASIAREALLMMLNESGYLRVSYSPLALQHLMKNNLLEIFGYLYAELLMGELRRGLYSRYSVHEENLNFMRGKMLMRQQMVNEVRRLPKAYCAYDEFSVNNPLNQFFKQTTRFLLTKVRTLRTVNLLTGCMSRFDGVDDADFQPPEVEQITVDRINRRFEPVLLLAKMFYHNLVMTMSQGKKEAFSILFAMNELFESYIACLCVRYLPYRTRVQEGNAKLWMNKKTGRGLFLLRPDIILEVSKGQRIIIDTKWKWIQDVAFRHGVSREDYYQMYAYLTRDSNARAAVLLYPHHDGLKEAGLACERYYIEGKPDKELLISSVTYEVKKTAVADLKQIIAEVIKHEHETPGGSS